MSTSAPDKVVTFEHRFFAKLEGAYFRLSEQDEPVLMVTMGDNVAALTFRGIKREFNIPDDCDDSRMLTMVARALRFVKVVKIGDPLPLELTTRQASWKPTDRHRQIAYQRLTMQLVSWLTGEETLITDPECLLQVAGDPQVRAKVNRAFEEAAVKLGLGKEHKQDVVDHLASLSHELAYVEGLRDIYAEIKTMESNIQALRRIYGRERGVLELVDQVARLGERAVGEFTAAFDELDGQTGEILSVLRNMEAQTGYIRDARDDLHRRLMVWDELLAEWRDVKVERSEANEKLMRRTYQFLAPRFMQVNEWTLMSQLQASGQLGEQLARAVAGKEPKKKSGGKVMRWM
ncbi:MAG: hypothetical protein HQL39_01935 [Alphaproteobacteria bacterium]|nr:hypothetical protein [Alphaproteobacteria bacterium]